jgi:hypothetical protein
MSNFNLDHPAYRKMGTTRQARIFLARAETASLFGKPHVRQHTARLAPLLKTLNEDRPVGAMA